MSFHIMIVIIKVIATDLLLYFVEYIFSGSSCTFNKFAKTDLHSFFELDAEVLKNAETLIQLKGVLVLTKEIDESASLFAQIQPASLQVLECLC